MGTPSRRSQCRAEEACGVSSTSNSEQSRGRGRAPGRGKSCFVDFSLALLSATFVVISPSIAIPVFARDEIEIEGAWIVVFGSSARKGRAAYVLEH